MKNATESSLDPADLLPGERVRVHPNDRYPYTGDVEDTCPQQSVVWIRDVQTGERKMLHTDECSLFPWKP